MGTKSTSKGVATQTISLLQGAWNQHQGDALNKALAEYGEGIRKAISKESGGFTSQSLDVRQGFAAEAHHAGSFNVEAAAKGQNNHRARLGPKGDEGVDIIVDTPRGTTKHQVKFHNDGPKTARALSPDKYDDVGKIVPKDQVKDVKTAAQKQALRNKDTRPNVSKSNQHTADNATGTLTSEDGKVSSTGLNRKGSGSAEELVKEAKKNENGPDYAEKGRVRREFNSMQYRNAAKAGLIGGAVTESAAILLEALRSDKPLTEKQCLEAAQRVVARSVSGAGNALLVTSIQHTGQAMIDAAAAQQTGKAISQAIGKQLVKGNVAAAVAQITVQLANNLYMFSNGKIDNLEFASSTIGGTVQVVGGSLAFGVGSSVGTYLGASVPAAISGYAIGGTTLGTLGVMASGAAFAIGFAVAAGAYVNHFSAKGAALAGSELKSALELLNGGQINLSTYVGKVSQLSELTFRWSDILPFSGAISVISEYSVRKNELRAIQSRLIDQLDSLPDQERAVMQELLNQYNEAMNFVDQEYREARARIERQASDQFDAINNDLSRHMEMRYLLFSPIHKSYNSDIELMEIKEQKQRRNADRAQAFRIELERLQENLKGFAVSDQTDRAVREAIMKTILARMAVLIPERTSWDQACDFLDLR